MRACLVLHVLFFVTYVYSLVYNLLYVGEDYEPYIYLFSYKGYGGKFKFLTFLNFLLQTVFFGLSIVNDLIGTHVKPSDKGGKKCRLQNFLDTMLAGLVYPVGTFVVMTFWGIYVVDRELVYPRRLDGIIPQWLNHVMHTTVLPFLLIEKYLVYHEYPSRRKGIMVLLAFAMFYLTWILWVAYIADIWVYPILEVMKTHQRVIFISVLLAFFVSIYILGESVNNILWKREKSIRTQKIKAKKAS